MCRKDSRPRCGFPQSAMVVQFIQRQPRRSSARRERGEFEIKSNSFSPQHFAGNHIAWGSYIENARLKRQQGWKRSNPDRLETSRSAICAPVLASHQREWQLPFSCGHCRAGGNPVGRSTDLSELDRAKTWIPACAGMTARIGLRVLPTLCQLLAESTETQCQDGQAGYCQADHLWNQIEDVGPA